MSKKITKNFLWWDFFPHVLREKYKCRVGYLATHSDLLDTIIKIFLQNLNSVLIFMPKFLDFYFKCYTFFNNVYIVGTT